MRVPNASPGAKSGLDHIVIGADALEDGPAHESELEPTAADGDGVHREQDVTDVPKGDLPAALAWVSAAGDQATASARADEVYGTYAATEDEDTLAASLRTAVYGDQSRPDAGNSPDRPVPASFAQTTGVPDPDAITGSAVGQYTTGQPGDAEPGQTGDEQGGSGPEPSKGAPSSDQSDQGPADPNATDADES